MSSFTDHEPPYQREKFSRLKHRQVKLTLKEDHQGHSRVFSETSVPSSLQSPTKAHAESASGDRTSEPSRNWFWNGLGRSASVADNHRGLQPLDEDETLDSFERQAIQEEDDEEVQGIIRDHQTDSPPDGQSQGSPTYSLSRSRSTNQMRDLRDQMTDLKGKISTLKQRAREDSLRRRSLQSLRTPSPLNNAEQDYSKIPLAEVQNRGSGLDGVPQQRTPSPKVNNPDAQRSQQSLATPKNETNASQKGIAPTAESSMGSSAEQIPTIPPANVETEADQLPAELKALVEEEKLLKMEAAEDRARPEDDFQMEPERGEAISTELKQGIHAMNGDTDPNGGGNESDGFEEQVGERHEDRADAFDYEHFFLHSSMGHYGRKRGSTHSSNYSTETERPPTMVLDSSIEERDGSPNKHVRQNSSSSVSTMATFATATEGEGEGSQGEEDEWTPRQTMAGTWLVDAPTVEMNGNKKKSTKPRTRKNKDSRQEQSEKRHRREHSVTDEGVNAPVAEIPDLMTYLKAILSKDADGPVELALNDSDKELADRVVKSLAHVCLDLQEFAEEGGKYESRVCRRKLDTARRHLDGEVNGEAF